MFMLTAQKIKDISIRNKSFIIAIIILIFSAVLIISVLFYLRNHGEKIFPQGRALEEAGKMSQSKDDFWWLNSGGLVYFNENIISTIEGQLEKNSKWQKLYAKNNPRDTENGYQPQNIFRLVTRQKFQNLTQSAYFKIDRINLSDSKYRDASNGALFFNRYQDGDNLYYAGLRVDGHAVIKKKIDGKYYTLAEADVYSGGKKYDREKTANFLPLDKWIGLKSEVINFSEEAVSIKLFVDKNGDGKWQMALEASDKVNENGKDLFLDAGYGGIRTDFMDVKFRDFTLSQL
jgi:hypothetical protein